MPITPFHFGPGALIKSGWLRMSFAAFCIVNVMIDVESGWHLVNHEYPVHTHLHCWLGATLLIPLASAVTWIAIAIAAHWNPKIHRASGLHCLAGAALGAWTHIIFDSVMHYDMRPLAPWSNNNGLFAIVPLAALHWFCLLCGCVGVLVWFVRRRNKLVM
jgi:hypothetical protein